MTDIIFDMDGTLAHMHPERAAAIKGERKDWKKFFDPALVFGDTPNLPIISIFRDLRMAAVGNRIIIATGRPEKLRETTAAWLHNYTNSDPLPIYMRANGDFRADDIVKEEMLAKIRAHGFNPTIAFDDRDRVVAMWRRNGLTCLQVAEGDF